MALKKFKKIYGCFIIINLLSLTIAIAQDSISFKQRPVFLQPALLYDFPQSYGLSAGASVPFASVTRQKVYHHRILQKQKDYFAAAELAFYRYPFNYTGVYFFPSIGVRVSKEKSNMYHEFAAGAGLLRTFYDGKVYEVDAAGNVKVLSLFGRYYATANVSYALGWQFKKAQIKKFSIQLKPSLWFQFPYNSFIKPHVSLQIGIRYHFSDISVRTKVRIKQKNK